MLIRIAPLIVIALGCLLVPAAEVGATPASARVALLDAVGPVRAWNGIAVMSVKQAGDSAWRLAISREGGALEVLPVAGRSSPFDADIGPGRGGEPTIVYSRCLRDADASGRGARGCTLRRLALTGEGEALIPGTDAEGASESQPTIWGDRLTWVRTNERATKQRPTVLTRRLDRSEPARRLPGLPTCRRPDVGTGRCAPTTGRVLELDQYRDLVAVNVTYEYSGIAGICGRREVRLATIRGEVRKIADAICGLSGQTNLGVSFDRGRLFWARTCPGDDGGCLRTGGAWRYDPAARRFALARLEYGQTAGSPDLVGYAAAGNGTTYLTRESSALCRTLNIDVTCGEVLVQHRFDFRAVRGPR